MFSKRFFKLFLCFLSIIYSMFLFIPQAVSAADHKISPQQNITIKKSNVTANPSRRTAISHRQAVRRIDNLADKQLDRTREMQRQQDERRADRK